MLDVNKISTFKSSIYNLIALNDLVTYAVYYLTIQNERISSENITAACFVLFPERFSLRGYPLWPDSTVVNKRWIDCRNRGYIIGSTAQDFKLTPKGLEISDRVEKILTGGKITISMKSKSKLKSETRTRAGRFVKSIEESTAYKKYMRSDFRKTISEFEFRDMLLCTMESSAQILKNNIEQIKQYVAEYDRKDLIEFLSFCENNFSYLLINDVSIGEKKRGGMLPKMK